MRTQSSDTNPVVEKKLLELIREQSISQRLEKTSSLTTLTLNLSRRAIARANPEKSKQELDLLFVEYHYGKELAAKVRTYIQKQKQNEK